MKHDVVEKNVGLLAVLITIVISVAGMVEIVPLMFQANVVKPLPGIVPLNALQSAGRDVYVREGCYNCHSQMIRPFLDETIRYGDYSRAGESVYNHPFQWGSKRTGPDLARVGRRYSDDWHRTHLINPRDLVPESNMPGFPWFEENMLDIEDVKSRMRAQRTVGVPYSDADIAQADDLLKDKTEMDAIIAYLQQLGLALQGKAVKRPEQVQEMLESSQSAPVEEPVVEEQAEVTDEAVSQEASETVSTSDSETQTVPASTQEEAK